MVCRRWAVAVLGIVALGFVSFPGRSQESGQPVDREAVLALSKKIDTHLAKVWKSAGVTPALKAEEHVFFRRLNLDIMGRTPHLLDVYDFMTDEGIDKRWNWVERQLESPEYSRHFANVWRHIILGSQSNQQAQFLMPQFEAWLRERVGKNVPLDSMVQQLLTSEQNNNNMQVFERGGNNMVANPQLYFVAAENKPENLAGVTSRVFLGIKIECAQCHAHPFAKWKKEQFWEFAAFFSSQPPRVQRPGIAPPPQPKLGYQPGRQIMIPGTTDVVNAKFLSGDEPKWDTSPTPRKTLSDWVTAPKNPYFARAMADHIWSYLMGVSLLEPLMEPSDDIPVTHPELLNDLAKALVDHHFDARFLIRAIVHSNAYQRSSSGAKLADKEDYHLFVRMPIRALSPEQLWDSVWMVMDQNKPREQTNPNPQFFNPNQLQNDRARFVAKFTNQDRRHEPQTSILQALFMMNGKFMAEKAKIENNPDLQSLAVPMYKDGHPGRIGSLYRLVLSRNPRPDEIARLAGFLDRCEQSGILGEGVSDIYWALLNSSEFMHNH